jgi:Concanavalin A-like lectin/glucanases superfamily
VTLALGHFGVPVLVGLATASSACENDVTVHLLPVRPTSPMVGSVDAGALCADGDPCSGRTRALYFRGAYDRVEIPSSPELDLPQEFAIEAWVLVKSYSAGHGIFNRWLSGKGDIELTFGTPEPLPRLELPSAEQVPSHVLASWGFVRPDRWLTVVAPALPSVDTWHHIASSYGGGSFRLYVDGSVAGSMEANDTVANPESMLYLGATARQQHTFDDTQGTLYWPPIDGFISDVRVSSNDRYAANFSPEPHLSVDASTIALWHLDEGDGEAAADSGPSQLSGTIIGATWALAPLRIPQLSTP